MDTNDYFGRLANTLFFKTPNKTARRSLSDELQAAVAQYDELSDAIDASGSNKRKPNIYDLLPRETVEQIKPVIGAFQKKWVDENPRRRDGMDAITGDHMREFATAFSQITTHRGFETLQRKKDGSEL